MSDVTKRLEQYLSGLVPLTAVPLIYLPFILGMQYSKHKWMISQPETWWGYLALLHSEAALYLLVSALALCCLRSPWWAFLICTVYYYLSFSDHLAWFMAGRPFHPMDLVRTGEFLAYYGEFFTVENIGVKRVVYAAVPIAAAATMLAPAPGRLCRPQPGTRAWKATAGVAAAGAAVWALLTPLVYSSSYFHHNSLVRMAKQVYDDWKFSGAELSTRDQERLFGAPQKTAVQPLRRLNLIMYVLETAPADLYPDPGPGLRAWADRSGSRLQILGEHYTPYPESDRAFLSMMTGNYPCLNRGNEWVKSYDYGMSLPRVLESNGYHTHLYSVAPLNFHNLNVMVKNLGFGKMSESPSTAEAYRHAKAGIGSLDRTTLYQADTRLLERALEVIRAKGDRPYLLVFMPQSSHAPFQVPPGYRGPTGQRDLLEANARWQMGLLQRMLDEVEAAGSAPHTLLVVAGDHGLRHPSESSLFRKQTVLSPISFKVAALICYPGFLPTPHQGVTSHIDLTPTLLDLLGIPYPAARYQGRSMLATMPKRSVFFLGGEYLPVSGFTAGGWYFMQNTNRDQIWKSRAFDFDSPRAGNFEVVRDKAERDGINGDLRLMKALLTR